MEIMKLKYLVASLFLGVMTFSCGEYGKLLEGTDYDKQYHEALKYFKEGKTSKTLALLVNVQNIYSGTDRSDTISFYIASSCFDRGDFTNSIELFDKFRKEYSRSVYLERAEYLYAMSFYNQAPNSELDQTFAGKAKSAFEEFAYRYPNSPDAEKSKAYIEELAKRIHEKDFYVGETYYKISYYTSAIITLKNILKKDAETPLREDIMFMILKSQYAYARSSIVSKQKDRFYDVIDSYYSLISQFPESKHAKIALKMYENADDFVKGKATISDLTSDVVRKHDKQYAKKEKIELKMLDEDKKGEKRNMSKLLKLKAQLDKINEQLRLLEEVETKKEAEVIEKIQEETKKETEVEKEIKK